MINYKLDLKGFDSLFLDIERIEKIIQGDLLVNAEEIKDRMKQRISTGKDMQGDTVSTFSKETIGRYSKRHGLARQRASRQTGVVDFQFTGELFENIKSDEQGTFATVEIQGTENVKKANENENYFETIIFTPSDSEIDEVIENYFNELFT